MMHTEFMSILKHYSPVRIEAPHANGLFGEFIFFGTHGGAPGVNNWVYKIDSAELDIIEARSIFYRGDWSTLQPIVAEFCEKYGVDEDTACELIGEEKCWSRDFPDMYDADKDWDTQRFTARCAKALGYDGVRVTDENGASYMIDIVKHFDKMTASEVNHD